MMQLPRKVGHFTLMRRLGADAVAESYVAILDEPAGKQVVARRIHPAIAKDEVLMARIHSRVQDLVAIRHPALAQVHGIEEAEGDAYVLEDWVEGVGLDVLMERAKSRQVDSEGALPHNVFLELATQICNGLEAMHGRPGVASGAEHVLHLGLSPHSIVVRQDGQLAVCGLGLVSSPTILPQSASGIAHANMEYLAPEQTHPDQGLSPATDVFALGSVLYELLTLTPLFRAASNLQTIHRVRKAEVTTELLEVKEVLPGFDRVLYRALSVNPRHRYQRAFVLREDLRGLMAGYSFADIQQDTRAALAPYLNPEGWSEAQQGRAPSQREDEIESTAALLGTALQPSWLDAETAPPHGNPEGVDLDADTLVTPTDGAPPLEVDHDAHTAPPGTAAVDLDADTLLTKAAGIDRVDHEAHTAPPGTSIPGFDVDHEAHTAPPGTPVPGIDVDADTLIKPAAALGVDTAPMERLPTDMPTDEATSPPSGSPGRLRDDGDTASFLRAVQGMGATPPPTDPTDAPTRTASEPEPPADTMAFLRAAGAGAAAGPLPEPELKDATPHAAEDAPLAGMAPPPGAVGAPLPAQDTQERPSPLGDEAPPSATHTVEEAVPAIDAHDDPDPPGDAAAAAEARKRLAPADSLHPPPSEPPAAPRNDAPTLPMQRPLEADDDDIVPLSSGLPVMPMVLGAALAAVAVMACLGMGGTGALFGATQMASTQEGGGGAAPAEVPAPEAAAPATAAPEPKAAAAPADPKPRTAPSPAPVAAASPRIQPSPYTPPAPRPVAASATPRPAPVAPPVATAPPPPEPAATTFDAIASADDVTQREQGSTEEEPLGPVDRRLLDGMASPAFRGALTANDRAALSDVPDDDPLFTRAHTLLYLDAKARGDSAARDQHLASLMSLPENQYNPALLVEEAWVAMGRRDWSSALARSDRAERHWARLPSGLIFSRKAMIYEIQAKAHLGSFYASEGDDASELDHAIKGWQKYKRHAETQARSDLMATADQQLARLYDIQRRLE